MDTGKLLGIIAGLVVAGGALAQASTGASQATQQMQEEREFQLRRQLQLMQLEQDEQRARARERCQVNRGVDCDTEEGLREWLLQDRTRAEAVLDGARLRSGALPPEAR